MHRNCAAVAVVVVVTVRRCALWTKCEEEKEATKRKNENETVAVGRTLFIHYYFMHIPCYTRSLIPNWQHTNRSSKWNVPTYRAHLCEIGYTASSSSFSFFLFECIFNTFELIAIPKHWNSRFIHSFHPKKRRFISKRNRIGFFFHFVRFVEKENAVSFGWPQCNGICFLSIHFSQPILNLYVCYFVYIYFDVAVSCVRNTHNYQVTTTQTWLRLFLVDVVVVQISYVFLFRSRALTHRSFAIIRVSRARSVLVFGWACRYNSHTKSHRTRNRKKETTKSQQLSKLASSVSCVCNSLVTQSLLRVVSARSLVRSFVISLCIICIVFF